MHGWAFLKESVVGVSVSMWSCGDAVPTAQGCGHTGLPGHLCHPFEQFWELAEAAMTFRQTAKAIYRQQISLAVTPGVEF